ncbi:flagellar hook capping FlgD N-terminal domain-containing protein [Pseudotabrizicola algicola]|uniref:Basal-body rod modification protein FlgD n=1 Tax=Pseudotabrizicola algicola TaxID=2709381 RepID=A0A6B3RJY5_9RHOB|nr:flagellar hook capping FlgD N-terminal domain-containing protein [Pseudotabrizicola algicola]NEX46367.1 flagellar basal body rod modification protein [Pseudotabrizicola algicola]
MDILQSQQSPAAGWAASATQPKSALASADFETFLKMLTVQMQNQDPMNPIDSADYAVQLATFSGVEQAVRTNQLLESLQTQFGVMGMAQLAGWVGQQARSGAPVYLDGEAIAISTNSHPVADRVVLVVKDAQGRLVAREDLAPSNDLYLWPGRDPAGAPLPVGNYSLALESYRGADLLASARAEHYAPIQEVRGGPEGVKIVLRGGIEVAATEVTALRAP